MTSNLPVLVLPEVYYRYEERSVGEGYTDERGEYISTGSHVEVKLETFEVLRHTAKGVWIRNPYRDNGVHGDRQFINDSWRKRFAAPTPEDAFRSFVARKSKQIRLLESKVAVIRQAVELAATKHPPALRDEVFKHFHYAPRPPVTVPFFDFEVRS
jgi:hypothetical protein